MTTVAAADTEPEVRDFTNRKRGKVRFRLDHADGRLEYFDGVLGLPALAVAEFAAATEKLDEAQDLAGQVEMFATMFNLVLDDESAARFIGRMRDKADPIEVEQVRDIIPWVMERYGMRPTQPSSVSSVGSGGQDGGTNSTEGAPPAGLMFETSPAIAS